MGLFGSLFTGVSGLNAESQATAMIANNISNTNTIGFKRSEASFSSLVTTQSRSSEFSPGTVSVTRLQRVDQQGALQQTSSSTDVAISGNGFFPVKQDALEDQEFLYTRSGSFSEDSQGLLRNTAGFVLYGWPINQNGELPADQGDLSSLQPLDVAFLGGLTRPTTEAELAINLDESEAQYNTVNIAGAEGAGGISLPTDDIEAHFTRGLTVYDSVGSAQTMTMEFRKVTGPMANITSRNGVSLEGDDNIIGTLTGIDDGDAIDITMGGDTLTIEFVDESGDTPTIGGATGVATVQEMLDAINGATFGTTAGMEARLNSSGQLVVKAASPDESFDIADNTTTNGTSDAVSGGGDTFDFGDDTTITVDYTDYETTYGDQTSVFPDLSNTSTPNTQGWWEMRVKLPNGSTLTEGLLNFNGDGSLNAAADADGNIDLELNNIDWGNGSELQDVNIDIERFSQFAGNYDVIFSDQNGAELGLRTGVEIDSDGIVSARFSNGATTALYKIPLVTFANANGLNEKSGTAYSENSTSGEENLREAGSGGAGFLEPSTLEGSNVDLADEFAKLIISQRTFSANSRLVSTVDEMTQELLRLR